MATRAVGFVSIDVALISKTPSKVFATRDCLKVVWVDTLVIAAKVINIEPIWDRPLVKLIRNPMSVRLFLSNTKAPVTLVVYVGKPKPAPAVRLWNEFLFKPF